MLMYGTRPIVFAAICLFTVSNVTSQTVASAPRRALSPAATSTVTVTVTPPNGRAGSSLVLESYALIPVVFTFTNRSSESLAVSAVRIRNRDRKPSQQLRAGNAFPKPLTIPPRGKAKMTVELACSWEVTRWRKADLVFRVTGAGKKEVVAPVTYKADPAAE